MIYFISLGLFCILFAFFVRESEENKSTLVLSILGMFIFFAFREGFTADYYNYETTFYNLHGGRIDQDLKYEICFQWLCQVLPSYRYLIMLFTALFCICLYIVFYRFIPSRYWSLSFIILFFNPSFFLENMSGMRSGFVTCFFFLAFIAKYAYDSNKRNRLYRMLVALAIMAIAFLFHRSAIVLFPLLFIPNKPLSRSVTNNFYLLVAILVAIIFLNVNQINLFLSNFVSDLVSDDYYDTYFEGDRQVQFTFFSLIKMISVIALMVITFEMSNMETNQIKNTILKYTSFFYFIALLPDLGMISRIYYYFAFPCIIGTAYVIQRAKGYTKTIYFSCITVYVFWQFYNFTLSPAFVYYSIYDNILF